MSIVAIAERARIATELGESHFREFKSALEGEPGNKKKRPTKDIATNIAQTLSRSPMQMEANYWLVSRIQEL